MFKGVILSGAMLLVVTNSFAGSVDFLPEKLQTWVNQDCRANQTCDLKAVRMSVQSYRANYEAEYGPGAFNYGDTMTFSFETDTIANLENYAMVQYVKGCVYSSFIRDGKQRTAFPYARFQHNATLRESSSVWVQKDWVIDSDDKDPVYNSPFPEDLEKMKHPSRQGLYRWNTIRNFDTNGVPSSREVDTESYLGYKYPPKYPKLYVTDRPGTAFTDYTMIDNKLENAAKNISLDFRACLYKVKDVPMSVDQMNGKVFIDNPVACFDWQSRYVYNWQKKKYESPTTMSEECLKYNP